jgi:predicted helicase
MLPRLNNRYAINLNREFPRIPFYADFTQWRDWGLRLLDLHIGYETIKPLKLKRVDVEEAKANLPPKPTESMREAERSSA